MKRRRLVLYIFLNVFVSALVSGTILFYYDRANHRSDCAMSETVPTLSSSGVNAAIVKVTGVGVLASESITIQNNGDTELLMTGWTLKDSQGSTYTFPQLTLYPGGTVQVHTGSGTDTSADLYWQLSAPVWESGELAALYDTRNIVRAFYRIP
jgi:Lamin Tail Domain